MSDLQALILEYARDLRRNSSGGDDYPWEYAKATADYLETLVGRASGVAQAPLRVVQLSKLDLAETIHKARWPFERQLAATPFADEDQNGREYCFRIAEAILEFLRAEERASQADVRAALEHERVKDPCDVRHWLDRAAPPSVALEAGAIPETVSPAGLRARARLVIDRGDVSCARHLELAATEIERLTRPQPGSADDKS